MDMTQLPRYGVATVAGVPVIRDRHNGVWAQPDCTWMDPSSINPYFQSWERDLNRAVEQPDTFPDLNRYQTWHPDAELMQRLNRNNSRAVPPTQRSDINWDDLLDQVYDDVDDRSFDEF